MDAETLAFTPAVTVAELIRTKQLSPVEYLQTLLRRIEQLEPRVNAFVHLDAGPAMDAAKRAEAALMGGGRIGRLHGMPVTIKDLAITKDHADAERQPDLRRASADRGHALRAAPAGRRRDRARQDHHVGIRLDRRVAQPADRHHA